MSDATWTWDHALVGVIPPMISPLGPTGEADAVSVERLANVAPRLMVELVQAARSGDRATCQRLHERVFDLTRIYTQEIGLAGIYAAAARLGLAQSVPAEPWLPVGEAEARTIDAILRAHELLPAAAGRPSR